MLRTALLVSLLALMGYASASWLTHDFQIWSAEGARRLEVAQQPVPVLRLCNAYLLDDQARLGAWLVTAAALLALGWLSQVARRMS